MYMSNVMLTGEKLNESPGFYEAQYIPYMYIFCLRTNDHLNCVENGIDEM